MKKWILLFLLIPSLLFAADLGKFDGQDAATKLGKVNGVTWGTTTGNVTKADGLTAASALTCQVGVGDQWVNNDTPTTTWAMISNSTDYTQFSQYVAFSGSADICNVAMYVGDPWETDYSTVSIKVCDTDCATNCSSVTSFTLTTQDYIWYVPTAFATSIVKTNDFRVCFTKSAGTGYVRTFSVAPAKYFGTADTNKNLVNFGDLHDEDFSIRIYYKQ